MSETTGTYDTTSIDRIPRNSTRYSITWSAISRIACGIVSPRALAVLRLQISSKVVGCPMGKSAGFAPPRRRSTYVAACRYKSSAFGP